MAEKVFAVENMVILTSKIEIDCHQWVDHIKNDYWEQLIKKNNTQFLVLSGTHGEKDGKLGDKDRDIGPVHLIRPPSKTPFKTPF